MRADSLHPLGRRSFHVVATMTLMALGFTGASAGLFLNFYRKYRARLDVGVAMRQYARIADYTGAPLPLAFHYRAEQDGDWIRLEVDVDEIYHYGPDYFLRGFGLPDRKGHTFKGSRIMDLQFRAGGRNLESVEALLGEVSTKEAGQAISA
jgi:hypothetical protein